MPKKSMVKEKCPNGHFYNKSRYTSCPYCARMNADGNDNTNQSNEKSVPKRKRVSLIKQKKLLLGNPKEMQPDDEEEISIDSANELPDDSSKEIRSDNAIKMNSTAQNDTDAADYKTISFYSTDSVDPVVGWLVCIKGKNYGECFNLYSGRNEIGRSAGMDISLPDEQSISKRKHAVVFFEPRHRKFYIQSGDSHGLTYLNGIIVVSHESLVSRDIIMLGDVVFVFMALCDDHFDWSDTEKYCR